jgi:tRNA A37 threonylcarbamoyladenosine modification protein TsaB
LFGQLLYEGHSRKHDFLPVLPVLLAKRNKLYTIGYKTGSGIVISAQKIIETALAKAGTKNVKFETHEFGKDVSTSLFENNLPEERFYNRTVIIDIFSAK